MPPVWTTEAPAETGKFWAVFHDYDLAIIGATDTLTASVVFWDTAMADYDSTVVDVLLWGPRFYRPTAPDGWREALAELQETTDGH